MKAVLDAIGSTRRQNVEGQLDMFGGCGRSGAPPARIHLPDIPEYSAAERMLMEKETTGCISPATPWTTGALGPAGGGGAYPRPFWRILPPRTGLSGSPTARQNVTIAGIVTSSRTRTTRNNALMAYVTVEDEAASIELLCFSRTIDRCGSYMEVNSPVLVQGKLSVRDESRRRSCATAFIP